MKRSFNDLFVNEEGRTFAPTVESIFGKDSQVGMWPGTAATEAKIVDTQTSYVVPLQFDLFNEKNKPLAIRHLVENIKKHNYTLTTGFIGTPYLNLVLSDNGYDDVAYKLFEQTAYPSWLYPVLQGATTIWERWNSYTLVNGFGPVDMNSFNHYSYGAIEEWMIAYTLGIQRDEEQPAYKHIILQPRIGGTFSFIRGITIPPMDVSRVDGKSKRGAIYTRQPSPLIRRLFYICPLNRRSPFVWRKGRRVSRS